MTTTIFNVNDNCTSCGICADICPAENIELVNGRPGWKRHCELCWECISLCPAEAIEISPRIGTRPLV